MRGRGVTDGTSRVAVEPDRRLLVAMAAGFGIVAVLVAADVSEDLRAGTTWGHAGLEITLMAFATAGAGLAGWHLVRTRAQARLLSRDLGEAEAAAERWRREAEGVLGDLGAAIDRQFDRWTLSSAEREIALLLLGGLALKEIAQVRKTTDGTVRQQALGVYAKAGLAGRAELSAFFLRDLLGARGASAAQTTAASQRTPPARVDETG